MKLTNLFSKENIYRFSKQENMNQLFCELCKCVLSDPVICTSCTYHYCKSCYNKFNQEIGCCPKMCLNPKANKAADELLTQLKSLEFKCINRSNGCSSIQKYADVVSHDVRCPFVLVNCSAYPLCDQKFLRRDVSLHEKICKYVKVRCEFCGCENITKADLEQHFLHECTRATKCTECNSFIPKENEAKTEHKCIQSFNNKIDFLNEVIEIQQVEINEKLRVRDMKVKSLSSQQRQLWKCITKLERMMLCQNTRVPSPEPTITSYENIQESVEQQDESECDFYAIYENEILNCNEQASFQTESLTDKDSSRSTQKSDTDFKLSVSQNTQLSSKKQSVGDSKFSKARKISEECKDELLSQNSSKIDSEESIHRSNSFKLTKESELFSCLEKVVSSSNIIISEDLISQKIKLLCELKDMSLWRKSSRKNNVDIYTFTGEGNNTGFMGIAELPYNPETIIQALSKPEISFDCNPFGDKMEVLEDVDEDTKILYMKFKGMMLVNGRDFVVCSKKVLINDTNSKDLKSHALISFSIDHPLAPEVPKGIVRGDIMIGGWILTKIDENKTSVMNMAINDLKGAIPKFVINATASSHSGLLVNFSNKIKQLNQKGLL